MAASLRPIVSLLIGVALLLAGAGMQFTFLPLRGSAEGFGTPALGVIGSAYYGGFVLGCLLGPYAILRAGHIRAFAAMVALAAAVALAYGLVLDPFAWTLFRFLSGSCLAGFYLVIESWLNDRASNETRGFVMSTYIMVNYGAIATGQLLVPLHPLDGAGNFMMTALLAALAIVPVALTRSAQPAPITIVSFRPVQLYRAAPVALVASFATGLAIGAFWSLAAVAVAADGLRVEEVAGFMSIVVVGGALAQWPAGRMSDRIDRRVVLIALLVGGAAAGLVLWIYPALGIVLVAAGFVFGALTLPCYAVAAAHGYDKTDNADMVPTAATILLVNGAGAVIGPLIAPAAMAVAGPRGLFLFMALVLGLLAAYVLHRVRVQSSLKPIDKTEFDLAATAPVGGVVPTEALDPAQEFVAAPEPYPPAPVEPAESVGLVPEPGDEGTPR